ncbi:hypothetical protein VTL71DRAFT_2843 [Oculimacula yallundae]|uniref:Uncharacterized protein n=1 Tax=Oculimacula yallundae TaxID=86028 RepID=A0ABR4CBD6_9HELO
MAIRYATVILGLLSAIVASAELTECYKAIKQFSFPPWNQHWRHYEWDIRCIDRWNFTGELYNVLGYKWEPMDPLSTCKLMETSGLTLPPRVKVLTTSEFRALGEDTSIKMAAFLSETYQTILQEYDREGLDLGSYIDLLLTTARETESTMETARDGCACVTFAGQDFIDMAMKEDEKDNARQSLAHEAYHCAQYLAFKDNFNMWVREGTADYFSNVVYPSVDYEWRMDNRSNRMYNPRIPIYADAERSYAMNLFFQSMAMTGGPSYVHSFFMGLPPQGSITKYDPIAERARLSKYPGFADDFYKFAKLYTIIDPPRASVQASGSMLNTQIIDSCAAAGSCKNGRFRKVMNHPDTWPTPLDGSFPLLLQAEPFTVRHFIATLDAANLGKSIYITSTASGNQRVAYRLSTSEAWNEIPGTVDIPCDRSDAQPLPQILFLFTSTDDSTTSDVQVTLSRSDIPEKRRDGETCESVPDLPDTPNATDVCGAASGPIDPCITSRTWILDNKSQEAFLANVTSGVDTGSVDAGITVTGTQTFDVEETSGRFVHSYKDLITIIYSSLLGLTIKSISTTNGFHAGPLSMKSGGGGNGTLCMAITEGGGTVSTVAEVLGKAEPASVTSLTAPSGAEAVGTNLEYSCSPTMLTFRYLRGGSVFGEIIYR